MSWSNGIAIDLNSLPNHLGWLFNTATAINDKGQIVVNGYNYNHESKAFLLTPDTTTSSKDLLQEKLPTNH